MGYRCRLSGDVDLAVEATVRADLERATRTDGTTTVLVDCTTMRFIDSTGIRLLVEAHNRLEADGRKLIVANVQPTPRRVFEILGLTNLLWSDQ